MVSHRFYNMPLAFALFTASAARSTRLSSVQMIVNLTDHRNYLGVNVLPYLSHLILRLLHSSWRTHQTVIKSFSKGRRYIVEGISTCTTESLATSLLLGGSRRIFFWVGIVCAVSDYLRS
jgi:hypothetical protein